MAVMVFAAPDKKEANARNRCCAWSEIRADFLAHRTSLCSTNRLQQCDCNQEKANRHMTDAEQNFTA